VVSFTDRLQVGIYQKLSQKRVLKFLNSKLPLTELSKHSDWSPFELLFHPEISVEIVANIARTDEEAKQQLKLGRAVITTVESDPVSPPAREETNQTTEN
jgi:hypothetical protein